MISYQKKMLSTIRGNLAYKEQGAIRMRQKGNVRLVCKSFPDSDVDDYQRIFPQIHIGYPLPLINKLLPHSISHNLQPFPNNFPLPTYRSMVRQTRALGLLIFFSITILFNCLVAYYMINVMTFISIKMDFTFDPLGVRLGFTV